jgi:hypothetical protein
MTSTNERHQNINDGWRENGQENIAQRATHPVTDIEPFYRLYQIHHNDARRNNKTGHNSSSAGNNSSSANNTSHNHPGKVVG